MLCGVAFWDIWAMQESEGRWWIDNVALWFWRRFLSTYLSGSTKGSPFTKNSYIPSLTHSLLASTCLRELTADILRPHLRPRKPHSLAQPFLYIFNGQKSEPAASASAGRTATVFMPNSSRHFLRPPDEISAEWVCSACGTTFSTGLKRILLRRRCVLNVAIELFAEP